MIISCQCGDDDIGIPKFHSRIFPLASHDFDARLHVSLKLLAIYLAVLRLPLIILTLIALIHSFERGTTYLLFLISKTPSAPREF